MTNSYKEKWIGISVFIIIFLLAFVVPFESVEQYCLGFDNESTRAKINSTCGGDKIVGIDAGCGRLSVYCEKYPYPVHAFSSCFDGSITFVWWFE